MFIIYFQKYFLKLILSNLFKNLTFQKFHAIQYIICSYMMYTTEVIQGKQELKWMSLYNIYGFKLPLCIVICYSRKARVKVNMNILYYIVSNFLCEWWYHFQHKINSDSRRYLASEQLSRIRIPVWKCLMFAKNHWLVMGVPWHLTFIFYYNY